MGVRITSSWLRPGLLLTLLSRLRLALRLLREPRVPRLTKAVVLLAALYLVHPIDFVPDLLPVLGQLDDLGVVALAVELFLRRCPPAAVAFHQAAIAGGRRFAPMPPTADVIDVEWRNE